MADAIVDQFRDKMNIISGTKYNLDGSPLDRNILMTMIAFLKENPAPSEEEVREALSGNLCRCTGYQNIVDAMMAAAQAMRAAAS